MKPQYKSKRFIILIISLCVITFLFSFLALQNKTKTVDLSYYEQVLENGQIKQANIVQNQLIFYTQEGKFAILKDVVNLNELSKKVPITDATDSEVLSENIAFMLFFVFMFILALIIRNKDKQIANEQDDKNKAFSNETMMPSSIKPTTSNINFDAIAGINDVKEELTEVVDFLKRPEKYTQYGIALPKGVLLVGPPGVGKTMIAKAIAGEAKVPFFYHSGANFVHIYVGMGAKRVRELFAKAKAYAPSIIFIDEIDATGKTRGGFANDERESTLNQLLTEMDGFEDNSGVVVIAATNRIEMIDEALLRSGRFDRRIFLSLPDLQDRIQILKVYLRNKPSDANIEEIGKMTVGFSGAALSTLVNEAAINALRRKSKVISLEDFLSVKDKVLLGKKKVLHFNENEKEIQALYQSAKALCAFWYEIDFDKITLLGDGLKDVDREIESKSQIMSKIKVYLAGIEASKIFYNEIFSNSKDDLTKARELAKIMTEQYGMGENLVPNIEDVNQTLKTAQEEISKFLEGMSEQLEMIKNQLLEKEYISKEELKNIIDNSF